MDTDTVTARESFQVAERSKTKVNEWIGFSVMKYISIICTWMYILYMYMEMGWVVGRCDSAKSTLTFRNRIR